MRATSSSSGHASNTRTPVNDGAGGAYAVQSTATGLRRACSMGSSRSASRRPSRLTRTAS
jgi:hypothetical protein